MQRLLGLFLQLLGTNSAETSQLGWNSATFFIVSGQRWAVFSPAPTAEEHGHELIITVKHCWCVPPSSKPRLVNACLAVVCGHGPTCGGVCFLSLCEKRRLLSPLPSPSSRQMSLVIFMSATIQHYRRQYPTEVYLRTTALFSA